MRDFYKEVTDILAESSPDYCIVPMADDKFENPAHTTVLTTGGGALDGLPFTYAPGSRDDWAKPAYYLRNQHRLPIVPFDGTNNWLETPDADIWDDSAATSEPSYCWAVWVKVDSSKSANHVLWTKSSNRSTSGQSWVNYLSSAEQFVARTIDDSAAAFIGSITSVLPNGWHWLVDTKNDDSIDNDSHNTYVDGVLNRSDSGAGTYVQQETSTRVVRIGALTNDVNANGLDMAGGSNGPIFQAIGTGAVWTPTQVDRLYEIELAAFKPQRSRLLAGVI